MGGLGRDQGDRAGAQRLILVYDMVVVCIANGAAKEFITIEFAVATPRLKAKGSAFCGKKV